jgi:hypothetical protein
LFTSTAKNNLLVVLYLAVITIVIFSITGQIYGVNDDVIIQNWLSGLYTGKPEFMIRGSATPKMLFGFLVSNLYSFAPQINWFSIVLLSLTLTGWYLIGLLAIRTKNFIVIFSFAIIAFLHLLWFIPSPTYTASAVLLSFSTIIFIANSIKLQRFNKSLFLIFLLYTFTYFVRPESFLLGTAIGGTFLMYSLMLTRNEFKNTAKKIYISALFCLFLVIGDHAFEKYFYTENNDWATYKQWETARYEIQANAPEKSVSDSPSQYGWTKAEVELFKSYNYIDADNFSVSKFENLISDSESKSISLNLDFLIKSHQRIFDSDVNWEWVKMISLIGLFYSIFLLLSFPKVFDYLLLTTASYSVLYIIMLYVAGLLRQPERVQVSVIFLAILISLLSFVFSSNTKALKSVTPTTIISSLLLILVTSFSLAQYNYLINKIQKWSGAFWYTQLDYLSSFPKDSVFLGNASQFRNNWISPYTVNKFEVEDRIFTFGWHNFSPHWVTRAKNLGLKPDDMFKSVIEDPRVYWVSDEPTMNFIVQYMKENSFEFTGPESVGVMSHFGEDYIVWDFNKND